MDAFEAIMTRRSTRRYSDAVPAKGNLGIIAWCGMKPNR